MSVRKLVVCLKKSCENKNENFVMLPQNQETQSQTNFFSGIQAQIFLLLRDNVSK